MFQCARVLGTGISCSGRAVQTPGAGTPGSVIVVQRTVSLPTPVRHGFLQRVVDCLVPHVPVPHQARQRVPDGHVPLEAPAYARVCGRAHVKELL